MNTTKFFSYVLVPCALLMSVLVPVDPASAATADVSVVNNNFVPGTVTISTGDSVTWTWAASTGGVPHNTRSDSGLWDSGIHSQPFTFTRQFSSTGTFPYHCDVHPGMNGSVVVQSGPLPEVPTITGQPQNQTVAAGATVTFTVQATGTGPLSYQWQLNGTDIPGANTSSLTLNNVTDANAGTYVVVVSNSAGSTTSAGAVLTVTPGGSGAPAITTQPQSQTIQAGNGVTFNVQASGTEPLGYQWRFNGTDIPGATANSLTLNNVSDANAGTYSVVVSNASGSVTSADAVLTVTPAGGGGAPTITTQPQSQTVAAGGTVTFTVQATGTEPLGYQWRLNGDDIPGATASSLTLNNVTDANAGTYVVVVSNSAGSATSSGAVLTVTPGGGGGEIVSGTYNGLFYVTDAITHETSGMVTLKLTDSGKFSGKLQSGQARRPFSGQLDSNNSATVTVVRPGQNDLTVNFQVDPNEEERLIGTVGDGTFTADLAANRASFSKTEQAPQTGQYTLAIPGSEDPSVAPGGDSVGTVKVASTGKIGLVGSLADITKFSQKSTLSKFGEWPLYVPLYGGQGSILGWVTFGTTPADGFNGNVVWTKPNVGSANLYPGGFVLDTTASGYHYVPPSSGNNILSWTAGNLTLSGGDLGQDVVNGINIGPKNKVQNLTANRLSLKFKPKTGTFSGRIGPPGSGNQIPFTGVVRQGLNDATGYFAGPTESGKVTLSAP